MAWAREQHDFVRQSTGTGKIITDDHHGNRFLPALAIAIAIILIIALA